MKLTEHAHAKVNLVLRVAPPRADGLHPLCSIFASLELADIVTVERAREDSVVCAGVDGPNLAAAAVSAFRAAVPALQPLAVGIEKRIPVAAGMGGGSADAAAVLRAANRLSGAGLGAGELRRIAAELGSDVPSQVEPRHALVSGVGELVSPLALPPLALVLLSPDEGLPTASVFAELDRLRARTDAPPVPALDPERLWRLVRAPVAQLATALENDLERATISLRPELVGELERLRGAGALGARITGSGPTAFGLFADRESAETAAAALPGAIVTEARAC